VEVDIEIKRTAKTLDERYRAGTRGSVGLPGLSRMVGSKRPIDDAQNLTPHKKSRPEGRLFRTKQMND
jgi:hypothetical protein